MKKNLLSIILFLIYVNAKAQNLVPNGDFEQYSSCPTNEGQIILAPLWTDAAQWGGLEADYYNKCSTSIMVGVPNTTFGYQPAHGGNGFSGIFLYSINWADLREYIESALTSPLVAGLCYHFEMYVNLGNRCQYTTDDIGVYFSDSANTGVTNYFPLPFTPQINNTTGNYPDTSGWTLISGNYTALGGESYIIIGNFKYDANTTLIDVNSSGFNESYIYIDDVSLTACTGIDEEEAGAGINIYPNPCNEYLVISNQFGENKNYEIIITDILGKKVYQTPETRNQKSETKISVSQLTNGIYFLEINDGKNSYRKKFLKESLK